ncbi:hypothetical protein SNE35_23730 [Paucibacter sp. R3-3]|uniref:Class I SAM-dependent methyltransferase n=1 Tax=Roseateles agri TaxID=3098619 RepID=A0ABU5DN20_9BURK|nr:hypothetical protein [Paucibacter sp. R3-3]MDY0747534.1 hypothetical protein [Paucibacter sp. R3-3]
MDTYRLIPTEVRDISPLLLDAAGKLRVVPASSLEQTTPQERLLFGVAHGHYGFPTDELVRFLKERIAGRSAIEIGSGNGVLARALGIAATDNRQQEDPAIRAHYEALRQQTVQYGDNVEKLDAAAAVAKFKPSVVVACWVTHKYDPARPEAEGSVTGIDEAQLLEHCDEYIFVGNKHVHRSKPLLARPHELLTPDWLYSRAVNGTPDFIAIWKKAS